MPLNRHTHRTLVCTHECGHVFGAVKHGLICRSITLHDDDGDRLGTTVIEPTCDWRALAIMSICGWLAERHYAYLAGLALDVPLGDSDRAVFETCLSRLVPALDSTRRARVAHKLHMAAWRVVLKYWRPIGFLALQLADERVIEGERLAELIEQALTLRK